MHCTHVNPEPKSKRRTWLILAGSLSSVVISASLATALPVLNKVSNVLNQAQGISPVLDKAGVNIQPSLNQANQYVQDASQYWNQLSSFYNNLVTGNLQGLLTDIQGVTGALGIPDPLLIRQEAWNEQIPPEAMVAAQAGANTADRAIATGVASIVLGQRGQNLIKDQQQQIATIAGKTQEIASLAQGLYVTQEIEKLEAVQRAYQTAISAKMSEQLTVLQLQDAAGNLMLSNVSGTLDQRELREQIEQQANSLADAQTAAQIYIPGINLNE